MTLPIISVENLGKSYLVGHERAGRESYTALRDVLARNVKNFGRKAIDLARGRQIIQGDEIEEFWALKDVSFDVKRGDVVGIIGRNGAGKSTLLKILSRITEPTQGRVTLRGRVASLLEVGTGFHPELTGRENIFLNGAILGMSRTEIRRKFDEIVEFAEVSKFLDTPVKRYSSGMYVRLAFAVAAHLEPEILVIDEVLAVGDASFQKKCLGKMQSVSAEGRTVLFVSHQLAAITRLCNSAVLLDRGSIVTSGSTDEVVHAYLSAGSHGPARRDWRDAAKQPGNEIATLHEARIVDPDGRILPKLDIRKPIGVQMDFEVHVPDVELTPNFHVYTSDGICAFIGNNSSLGQGQRRWDIGRYVSTMWIPGNFLSEGTYVVGVALSTMNPLSIHFYEPDAIAFEVVDSLHGDSARGDYAGPYPGVVRPVFEWTTDVISKEVIV